MAKEQNTIESLREKLREAARREVSRLSKLRQEHEDRTQPLLAEKDRLLERQQELQREIDEVVKRINEEVYPERKDLDASLSAAARDAGGRFLSDT